MVIELKKTRTIILTVLMLAALWFLNDLRLEAQYASLYLENSNYSVQVGMYERFRTEHADVVMLGNSLTYNANWNELLGRSTIANRGIVSDITAGYLHRLQYVYRLSPKLCFIEGGVNDVYAHYTPKQIFNNYRMIIDTLRRHNITPVIQSTLCVGKGRAESEKKNDEIRALNELLKAYTKENGVVFLDINALVTSDGYLRDELTYDQIHLNAAGYALWVPEVETVLKENGL